MSTPFTRSSKTAPILGAWHAQVAVTAKHSPWLVREMLRRKQELLPKFTAYYQQLRALPRRTRRVLQRKLAQSLAGAALLLALGNGQAIAATINVTINVPDLNADGQCSLIEAIINANDDAATHADCVAGSAADTIELTAGSTHTLTAVNNSTYDSTGLPVIASMITIEGNGSTITRDSGAADFRIVAIANSGDLTLQETTVSGGVTANLGDGGGVYNRGTLTLTDSTISGNSARWGGGMVNSYSTATLSNSTVSGNTGTLGGGMVNSYSTATLSNSTITGNTATIFQGGGMSNYYSMVTLTNSTITGNAARFGNGGGVYNYESTVTLSDSTISGNSVYLKNGGGMANSYSTATLSNSTISVNSANYAGGGVFNRSSTVTLSNSTISGNSAGNGGGVTNNYSTVTLSSSTISENSASHGGGVYNSASTVTLTNSTISGNSAFIPGGGMYNNYYSTVTLTNSTITGNTARFGNGGGVYNSVSTVTLSRTLISGNTAVGSGVEVHGVGSTVTADNFNLFGRYNFAGVVGFTPGATDLVPSGALSTILNATLADNSGPTQTHALVAGSPAIDASPVDADCLATDQRGVSRPQGVACDIGAFEGGGGGPGPKHDLAVLKVIPPKTVTLTSKKPVQSKAVTVQIQNQGEVDETIPDAAVLASLVQLNLESLDTVNDCLDLVATLNVSTLKFPLTLKAGKTPTKGKKLTVSFTVAFDRNECIPDPLKSSKKNPGHEDYRPRASVDLNALGETDVDPTDDALEGQLIDVVNKP